MLLYQFVFYLLVRGGNADVIIEKEAGLYAAKAFLYIFENGDLVVV